jgi:uncharacterized membrane protein YeaQ/YmgE (transglycosylase-associated protein family)
MALQLGVFAAQRVEHFSLLGFLIALFVGGLIVGALARLLVPGPQPMGILATAGIGIAGSVIGGLLGRLIFGPHYAPGLIISVLGAALLVWAFYGRRRPV